VSLMKADESGKETGRFSRLLSLSFRLVVLFCACRPRMKRKEDRGRSHRDETTMLSSLGERPPLLKAERNRREEG